MEKLGLLSSGKILFGLILARRARGAFEELLSAGIKVALVALRG